MYSDLAYDILAVTDDNEADTLRAVTAIANGDDVLHRDLTRAVRRERTARAARRERTRRQLQKARATYPPRSDEEVRGWFLHDWSADW